MMDQPLLDLNTSDSPKPPAFLPDMNRLLNDVRPGAQLQGYRIGQLIGYGGMGAVYRAIDTTCQQEVAIKFLLGSDGQSANQQLQQFKREADIIRRLDHRSIVSIRDFVTMNTLNFMVMELFLGPNDEPMNLADYAAQCGDGNGLLDEADMKQISLSLLNALSFAHENNVVHCDLKPENILFKYVRAAEPGYWCAHLKLTDFGLAKLVGEEFVMESVSQSLTCFPTVTGDIPLDANALIGTYDYMSPEQRDAQPATFASDIFTVGLIILRLLTGAKQLGLRNRPTTLRPGINSGWDDVILTAMREDPSQRFVSADDMHDAIEQNC